MDDLLWKFILEFAQNPPLDAPKQYLLQPASGPWTWENIAFVAVMNIYVAVLMKVMKVIWRNLAQLVNEMCNHEQPQEIIDLNNVQ